MDFTDISRIVKPMIDDFFDHKWLNTTLNTDSATAEYMAKWIFDYLTPLIQGLCAITIHETDSARVTYRERLKG